VTIHLSKDLEEFVQDAVRAGLYAREDDVIRDALLRLKQTMPKDIELPSKKTKRAQPSPQKKKPLSRAEFDQRLLELGLMSQLPETDAYFDDPDDEPIEIKGEPISETIIRERR
jgi:Arc/MetJ-type ribon-helix-helix transcriptional regulator